MVKFANIQMLYDQKQKASNVIYEGHKNSNYEKLQNVGGAAIFSIFIIITISHADGLVSHKATVTVMFFIHFLLAHETVLIIFEPLLRFPLT